MWLFSESLSACVQDAERRVNEVGEFSEQMSVVLAWCVKGSMSRYCYNTVWHSVIDIFIMS